MSSPHRSGGRPPPTAGCGSARTGDCRDLKRCCLGFGENTISPRCLSRLIDFVRHGTIGPNKNSAKQALVAAHVVYRIRARLLCVDRESRAFVQLQPGAVVFWVGEEDEKKVVLRWGGRDVLAFAADFQDRAEEISGAAG